jgi:hypothetical protein
MIVRVARFNSRHQTTSVWSPNVQTIAMPEPLSACASGCASTGTRTPNSGVVASLPNSGLNRSSSGWATSATHAASSSGLVVSMKTGSPATSKRSRW